jgi:flagellar basal body-associated protein FliL
MKKTENKRTLILVIILLGLMVVAYKMFFGSSDVEQMVTAGNADAGKRIENILGQMERINFDVDTTQGQVFQSLQTIEIPLVSLPIGKVNPFSALPN